MRYFDEGIAVLWRERNGEGKTELSVARIEVARDGIHENTSSFTPHFSRTRNILQCRIERSQSVRRAVQPIPYALPPRLLVRQLDQRGPQPPCAEMVLERLPVEPVGLHDATLPQQLVDSLEDQFPLRREAENVLANHLARLDRLSDEVQDPRQLQTHRVRAVLRRELRAAH